MVTWQNYEEYMMMLVDGELSSREEQELMAFIAKHPELKSELAAFNTTKLEPETYVFEKKETLLKPEPAKKVIAFPNWQRYSIAAGVAAIVFISLFKLNTNENRVASVVEPTPVKKVAPVAPAQKENIASVVPVKTESATTPGQQQGTEAVKPTTVKREGIASVTPATKGKNIRVKSEVIEKQEAIAKLSGESISEIALAGPKQINSEPAATMALNEAPTLALVGEIEDEERGSFLKNLGIADARREGMEAVANAVTSTLDKAHSIKKDIDSRGLSVRIENKRLILSF